MNAARKMLKNLGADARGVLTVIDPTGRQILFTSSSFTKSDLQFAALLPMIISKPDEYTSAPARAMSLYGKKAKEGYYVVVLEGYNVNQRISLYAGKGDSISSAMKDAKKLFP